MADRYWVGGTANWDGTAGTKWATTSGGAGGASVPTSADDVYFDAASGSVTCTVSATANCLNLNFTGFTGTFSMANTLNVYGSCTLSSGMTFGATGSAIQMLAESGSRTFTSAGKTIGPVRFGGLTTGATFTLQDALVSSGTLTVALGTFNTNNYNVTATSLASSNTNARTINLGSSTVTLSSGTAVTFTTSTNLTLNAGTSQITCTGSSVTFAGGGQTFYNVSFTGTSGSAHGIDQANTFNNLTIAGRSSAGVLAIILSSNQTINGTLTLSATSNATIRGFVRSDTIGTTRTLTCNAVASLTDIDFRDITITGSAAPVSGTRLGDCKGNSGITFDAGKTVYWRNATSANWGATAWSFTDGGTADVTAFPLAQDTAIIPSGYPNSGQIVTINAAYNIGTIDMSARTSNTMTLACFQAPAIYGNWINGTGTTLSGTGTLTFAGRGSQTITSAGKTFTQLVAINTPTGSVTIQDAIIISPANSSALNIISGTFDANSYNVTLSTGAVNSNYTSVRTIAFGSGTWSLGRATTAFDCSTATNLTVTGTGTISLTSSSSKVFNGGGIQSYPVLNQGGVGILTVTGSNKFIGLTNTAIGGIRFTASTTNEFTTTFDIDGASGNLLELRSTTTSAQAILIKPSAWLMGANSTDAGNNTGLSFTGGGDLDYLSVSYINGQVSTPPVASNSNFFLMFA